MISLSSLLSTIDLPAAESVKDQGQSPEGTENSATDGFSVLMAQLDQLAAPLVTASGVTAASAGAASDEGPTGKMLPADRQILAGLATQPVKPGDILASASILPFRGELVELRTGATGKAELAATRSPALPAAGKDVAAARDEVAGVRAQSPAQSTPAPQAAALAPNIVTLAAGKVGGAALQAQQVRISVTAGKSDAEADVLPGLASGRPVQAKGATPVVPEALAAKLEGGAADNAAKVAADGKLASSGENGDSRAAQKADRAEATRPATAEKEAAQTSSSRKIFTADASAGKPATLDVAKPAAMPLSTPIDTPAADRQVAARPAAQLQSSPLTSVEGIEKLVDRLAMARDFDLSKPATIAVAHREFGALNVTFDNSRSGLDVEITAKDVEMQRALAGAMAADRQASRGADAQSQTQTSGQSQHHQAQGSERGGTSGGHGFQHSEGGAQGERPQHQQRSRSMHAGADDRMPQQQPSAGDDALYA